MSMCAKDFGERLQDSYEWYLRHRDEPTDIEKRLELHRRALDDLYSLMSHILEVMATFEGLPPGSLGRRLWVPSGMTYSGSLKDRHGPSVTVVA